MEVEQVPITIVDQPSTEPTTPGNSKKRKVNTTKSRKKTAKGSDDPEVAPEAVDSEQAPKTEAKPKRSRAKAKVTPAKKDDVSTGSDDAENGPEAVNSEQTPKTETKAKRSRAKANVTPTKKEEVKASDEMCIEAEVDPSTLFFKKSLPGLRDDLRALLKDGLPMYTLKPYTDERFSELVEKYKAETDTEAKDKVIAELLVHQVDNSSLQIAELADKCQEYLNTLDECFKELPKEYLMEKILAVANYMNYSVKHDVPAEELEKAEFKLWEFKNEDSLLELADLAEVSRVKKLRMCQKKVLENLVKYIKSIEKMKSSDESAKVIDERQKYEKSLKTKADVLLEATQPKSAKKTKKSTVTKDGLSQSVKKMKIDSSKQTPSTTPSKDSVMEEQQTTDLVEEVDKKANVTPQKVAGEKDSKSKSETATKPVKNNSLLTQFFVKKPQSEVKKGSAETQQEKKKEKDLLRCLGSKKCISVWAPERQEEFLKVLEQQNAPQVSAESLRDIYLARVCKPARRSQLMIEITTKKCRKIFVNIQDSFRKIKGKFDSGSAFVSARNPFTKDPQVDYDMDSEEEYENQFADNLDDEDAEDKEEEDDEDDEGDDFIVPDGYLSSQEMNPSNEMEGDDDDNSRNMRGNKQVATQGRNNQLQKPFYFSLIDYKAGGDFALDQYLENFKIEKLADEDFPLKPKDSKKPSSVDKSNAKLNPNAIDEKENLLVLVRALHGSYTNKEEVVKEVNIKVPHCSKNSIERKIKEISSRDKLEGENKRRLLVKKELFDELSIEPEYEEILNARKGEQDEKDAEARRIKNEEKEKEKEKQRLIAAATASSQVPASNQMSMEEFVPSQTSSKGEGQEHAAPVKSVTPVKKTPTKAKKSATKAETTPHSPMIIEKPAESGKSSVEAPKAEGPALVQTLLTDKLSKSRIVEPVNIDKDDIQYKDEEGIKLAGSHPQITIKEERAN